MLEVIPNWHPVFVHFPIALLTMATLFFVVLTWVKKATVQEQLKVLAYWNLWLGTGFAVVTVIAGWFAYNSVAHDTPSHEAMTEHRNWALVTLTTYIIIALWAWRIYKSKKVTPVLFTLATILAFPLLLSTGWHGSEIVYRHGLGVMSLPQTEAEGHDHQHGEEHMQNENKTVETTTPENKENMPAENQHNHNPDDHSQHDHAH